MKETWERFKEIPRSVKFWNFLLLGAVALLSIFQGVEFIYLFWFIGSIASLALAMDSNGLDDHLWIWFTPLLWIILIVGVIVEAGAKQIKRFNSWLDKKEKNQN